MTNLQEAIEEKNQEIAARERDLTTPFYQGNTWCQAEIESLKREVRAITNHIKDQSPLQLPVCAYATTAQCLLAHKGFPDCSHKAYSCAFHYVPKEAPE